MTTPIAIRPDLLCFVVNTQINDNKIVRTIRQDPADGMWLCECLQPMRSQTVLHMRVAGQTLRLPAGERTDPAGAHGWLDASNLRPMEPPGLDTDTDTSTDLPVPQQPVEQDA